MMNPFSEFCYDEGGEIWLIYSMRKMMTNVSDGFRMMKAFYSDSICNNIIKFLMMSN